MGITRELVITYGGWSSVDDQLSGPYGVTLEFETVSVVFQILVSRTTAEDFVESCALIETALSLRDQSLVIDGPESENWLSEVFGSNALNTTCAVAKSGDQLSDTGRSRLYTATFTCQRPAADNGGFATLDASVSYRPSRQRVLNVSGMVRDGNALTAYQAGISGMESGIKTMLASPTVAWELTGEDFEYDRNNHVLTFKREHTETLYPEAEPDEIVSQQVSFTRLSAYPGDGDPTTNRPERFVVEFDCNIDKELKYGDTELKTLYEDTIYPWLLEKFAVCYEPTQYAVTEHQRQIRPTLNTIAARLTILAYMPGSDLLEYSESTKFQRIRTLDVTPVWDEQELDAYVDQQFMVYLRVMDITQSRLGVHSAAPGLIEGDVHDSGWNEIQSSCGEIPLWLGEGDDRVRITMLTEQVTSRWTRKPSGIAAGPPISGTPPGDGVGADDPGNRSPATDTRR